MKAACTAPKISRTSTGMMMRNSTIAWARCARCFMSWLLYRGLSVRFHDLQQAFAQQQGPAGHRLLRAEGLVHFAGGEQGFAKLHRMKVVAAACVLVIAHKRSAVAVDCGRCVALAGKAVTQLVAHARVARQHVCQAAVQLAGL